MLISVVTATYACEDTIGDCLASVASQSYPDVEHVAIDGASPDGTLAVLEGYRDGLAVLVSEPDGGIYDALNKGISRSTGDAVGFLHGDDVYADENVLERIATAFEDPSVHACYGDLVYVDKQNPGRVLRYWRAGPFIRERLNRGWMPPHPTLYIRRSLYERHGAFDTSYRIAADYECILRILSRIDGRVVYVPEVLVRMRVGGASNRSLRNIILKSREDLRAIRAHDVGGLPTLAWKNLSKLDQFVRR